jgi:hypothetical protein
MRLRYRWFVMVCLLLLLIGGVSFACPVPASAPACGYHAAASYSYQAVYPVAVQYVLPYTPVVTVPAQAVQVQQVVPQQAPQPQAEMPAPAPAVMQRSVQSVYATPLAAVVPYSAAVGYSTGYAAAGVHAYGAQRSVVVQRAVVARPARVVIQHNVQRRGVLGRIADRLRARRAGGAPSSTTVIVR